MHRDDFRRESGEMKEETHHSSHVPDAIDGAITPPLDRTLILDLLIETALTSDNPVEELHAIQADSRFDYKGAQRDFCDTLWNIEQRHFDKLVSSSQYSAELVGAIRHRGEIFVQLNAYHIPSASINAWLQLASEEIEFLNHLPEWNDADVLLCSHALSVLEELVVNGPSEWSIYEKLQANILQQLEGMSHRFFHDENLSSPPEEANRVALLSWLVLANDSGIDSLKNEAAGLIPQLLEIWKLVDQRDGDSESEDESLYPQSECDKEGDTDSEFLLENLENWRANNQEESTDETFAIDSDEDNLEWREGFELSEIQQWEHALTLALQAGQSRIDLDDEFILVLHTADIGSDLWQSAFDGLLVSSYAESLRVIESLFDTVQSMPGAMRHITSPLDASERISHKFYYSPPDLLQDALQKEKPRARRKILKMISKYIEDEKLSGGETEVMASRFNKLLRNLRGLKR